AVPRRLPCCLPGHASAWSILAAAALFAVVVGGLFAPSQVSAQTLTPGTLARTLGPGCTNLRALPTTNSTSLGCLSAGTLLIMQSGTASAEGYEWQMATTTSTGISGWIATEFIVAETSSTPTATPTVTVTP